MCTDLLDKPLALLFKMSPESGKVPKEWRRINVILRYKKSAQ